MAIRILSSLLVALALIAAPLGMAGGWGAAIAAPPAAAAGKHDGHCGDTAPTDERKAPGHIGCASGCAAVPAAPAAIADPSVLPARPPALAMSAPLGSIAPERETPPPRGRRENRT